jgi:hypothetical protein
VLSIVCFTILALEGMPKLKKKEAKAREGEMAEHEATTKVVSGIYVHLWPHQFTILIKSVNSVFLFVTHEMVC